MLSTRAQGILQVLGLRAQGGLYMFSTRAQGTLQVLGLRDQGDSADAYIPVSLGIPCSSSAPRVPLGRMVAPAARSIPWGAAVQVEEQYEEDCMEFDPYLFIRNLPPLSSVVPSTRSVLLPRQVRPVGEHWVGATADGQSSA